MHNINTQRSNHQTTTEQFSLTQIDNINCIYELQSKINELSVQRQKNLIAYENIQKTKNKLKYENQCLLRQNKQLEQQLSNMSENSNVLSNQIQEMKKQRKKFQQFLRCIPSNVHINQLQLQHKNINQFLAKIQSLHSQRIHYKSYNQKLLTKIQKLQTVEKHLKEQNIALIANYNLKIKQLQQKVSASQLVSNYALVQHNKQLEEGNKSMKNMIEIKEQRERELMRMNQELKKQVENMRKEKNMWVKERVKEEYDGQKNNKDKGKEVRGLIRQNRVVSAEQYNACINKLQNLIQQHSLCHYNLQQSQNQLQIYKNKSQIAIEQIQSLHTVIKQLQNKVTPLNLNNLSSSIHTSQDKNNLLKNNNIQKLSQLMLINKELQKQLDRKGIDYQQCNRILSNLTESQKLQIQILRKSLQQSTKTIENISEALLSAEQMQNTLRAENKNIKANNQKIKDHSEHLCEQIRILQQRIKQIYGRYSQQDYIAIKKKYNGTVEYNQKLEQENHDLRIIQEKMQSDNISLKKNVNQLEIAMKGLENRNKILEGHVREYEGNKEKQLRDLKQMVNRLNEDKQNLVKIIHKFDYYSAHNTDTYEKKQTKYTKNYKKQFSLYQSSIVELKKSKIAESLIETKNASQPQEHIYPIFQGQFKSTVLGENKRSKTDRMKISETLQPSGQTVQKGKCELSQFIKKRREEEEELLISRQEKENEKDKKENIFDQNTKKYKDGQSIDEKLRKLKEQNKLIRTHVDSWKKQKF